MCGLVLIMKTFEEWLVYQKLNVETAAERDEWKRVYDEMKANSGVRKEESLKESYADYGTQYYVAGRLTAKSGLLPAYGNLFHHAVELYLKSALISTLTLPEMKKQYGHNLNKLWKRYKATVNDPALDRFDSTITALHEFESIRYPDEVVEKGMQCWVTWTTAQVTTASGPAADVPKYQVIISDIDNLVLEVLNRIRMNPKFFASRIHGNDARAALAYQNAQVDKWGLEPS
jgi:hypothetical protein